MFTPRMRLLPAFAFEQPAKCKHADLVAHETVSDRSRGIQEASNDDTEPKETNAVVDISTSQRTNQCAYLIR